MDDESIKKGLWDDHRNISLTEAENIIKSNLNGCARNFVAIGFYLKDIRDNETYRKGGYESISDFAQDKLQMAKSTVSRFMAINDRFSVNGNTPVLMDKYLDYGSGKLQEMLTMTDEEIANINPETTVKEIREIKKNRCDAQLEPEKPLPLSAVGKPKKVYPEGSALSTPGCEGGYSCFSCGRDCQTRQEGRYCVDAPLGNPFTCTTMNVHENLRTDIGDKCMFVNLDLARIRSGDKEPVPCCKECTEKCGYECNRSAHGVNKKSNTSPYDDKKPDIGVTIYNVGGNGKVEKFEVVSKYSSFSEKYFGVKDKSGNIHNLSSESEHWHYSREDAKKDSWYREKTSVTSEIVNSNPESEVVEAEVIQGDELVLDCYNDEEGWHKEIIQSSPDPEGEYEEREIGDSVPDPESYGISGVKVEIKTHTEDLIILRKENVIAPVRYKTKMRLDAANALLDKLKGPVVEDENIVKKMVRYAMDWFEKGDYSNADFYLFHARKDLADTYEYDRSFNPDFINDNRRPQPVLPTLKNNDQRKEWIDNYTTWPLWIDLPHTGEKFYRYDLKDKVAIVVKVSRKHAYAGYKETKDYEYAAEQYYLLGVKTSWSANQKSAFVMDDTRTFHECNTNKSNIAEYLKEFQKKG